MRRRRSRALTLVAALFIAFSWGGITAGRSFADPVTYSDMGYTLTDLGTLGGSYSWVTAINEKGQVVGWSTTAEGEHHAFLYSNGTMTDLGTLGGSWSEAYAINGKGQVVGLSTTAAGEYHAFLYSKGTMTDLGTLGRFIEPYAINDKGQVVGGYYTTTEFADDTFLYSDGMMTDLSLGGSYSWVNAINDKGQVIGWSTTAEGEHHAFLYSKGTMTDLTQVVSDLFLVDNFRAYTFKVPFDVDDFRVTEFRTGQIVGTGSLDGTIHAYILTVPNN